MYLSYMKLQIIGDQTGAINFQDGFIADSKTTEDALRSHFSLPESNSFSGWKYYTLQNIKIGDLYFIITCNFLEKELKTISMIFGEDEIIPSDKTSSEIPGANEIKNLDKYEDWLTGQLGENRNFDWGKVEAMFHKRSGGAMVYMEYNG